MESNSLQYYLRFFCKRILDSTVHIIPSFTTQDFPAWLTLLVTNWFSSHSVVWIYQWFYVFISHLLKVLEAIQGQFLTGVRLVWIWNSFNASCLITQSAFLFTHFVAGVGKRWVHVFPKGSCAKWNVNSLPHVYIYLCNFIFFEAVGLLVWLVGFYGISNFVGYLTPNPFLWK